MECNEVCSQMMQEKNESHVGFDTALFLARIWERPLGKRLRTSIYVTLRCGNIAVSASN